MGGLLLNKNQMSEVSLLDHKLRNLPTSPISLMLSLAPEEVVPKVATAENLVAVATVWG